MWRCYGIGQGKRIPYDDIYIKHQGPTKLQTSESQGFYDPLAKREVKRSREAKKKNTKNETQTFECSIVGCENAFQTFSELQLHLDIGKHNIKRMNQYDELKRDWALKFSSVDTTNTISSSESQPKQSQEKRSASRCLQRGWALHKPRSSTRFSQNIKDYLTARFNIGERTGRKSDPAQVALDMRSAKDESNERLFTRSEWLTKNQIQSFFSRLAAARRKLIGLSAEQEEDAQCLQEDDERRELVGILNLQINVSHPICYDTFDLCERFHNKTLHKFDVAMLKTICKHFEISYKSRDKKQVLIQKISEMINDCECTST